MEICGRIYELSFPDRQRKGGGTVVEVVISFLVAVAAGVTCHYVIKWLDSRRNDDN